MLVDIALGISSMVTIGFLAGVALREIVNACRDLFAQGPGQGSTADRKGTLAVFSSASHEATELVPVYHHEDKVRRLVHQVQDLEGVARNAIEHRRIVDDTDTTDAEALRRHLNAVADRAESVMRACPPTPAWIPTPPSEVTVMHGVKEDADDA